MKKRGTDMKQQLSPTEKKRKKKKIRKFIIAGILIIGILLLMLSGSNKNEAVYATVASPVTGSVEENVNISGTVESEETKVYFAPVSGRLSEVSVEAGDVVQAGDLLIAYDLMDMEENLKQAELQYIAAVSSGKDTLADNSDAGAKLKEAETNLSVLEQQITDSKAYLKALRESLTARQNDAANLLAAENLKLQKELIELQKDPVANQDAIAEVQIKMQNNQYAASLSGMPADQKDLQQKIEAEEEKIAACEEYKAEMEAQKQQAEARILSSYQKENLSATEQLNTLSYEKTKENYDRASQGITAEFNGIVTETGVVEGMTVTEGIQLLTLAGTDHVRVAVSVTKYDLAKISLGQKADITINGKVYEGTVSKINRMATASATGTASVGVQIHIENPDDNIYMGLDAKVEIHTGKAENALLIPVEALNADKNGDFVYVVENGIAVRKDIVTGISSSEYIEVKEGLKETDLVILSCVSAGGVEDGMAVIAVGSDQ